ncbi:MAG TPA: serine/threonine protein kinase, partial [Dermatophilaceae bacterium]|nr:serine/threonine protein kinase [Dermatophilaceae bacterium]
LSAALSPRPDDRPPAEIVMAALERYAAGGFATDVMPLHHGAGAVAGQVSPRHTAILPTQPPTGSPYAVPPPMGYAAPAPAAPPVGYVAPAPAGPPMGYAGAPAPWPSQPQWHAPAPVAVEGVVSRGVPEPDEDVEDLRGGFVPGAGGSDPRIGRPDRTGTLVVAGLFLVALAAVMPVVAVLVLLAWSVLARTADRSMTSIVLRRFENGWRRGDVPVTVAMGPWHLLTGAIAAAVGLVLPLMVGIGGVFCVALALSAATGTSPNPNHPVALGGGMALCLLMAWWGPGGASLRRGSRSMLRGVVREGLVTSVVVTVLVVGGLVALVSTVLSGGTPSWAPLSAPPGFFSSWR